MRRHLNDRAIGLPYDPYRPCEMATNDLGSLMFAPQSESNPIQYIPAAGWFAEIAHAQEAIATQHLVFANNAAKFVPRNQPICKQGTNNTVVTKHVLV